MAFVTGEACPLTGQPAKIEDGTFDGWSVTGAFTDGAYRIARSAIEQARATSPALKSKLVAWIIDRHRAGEPEPMISSNTFEQVKNRPTLSYDQKVDRFFQMLKSIDFGLGKTIKVSGIVDENYHRSMGRITAWLELQNQNDVSPILQAIATEGLLAFDGSFYRLTANGMRRLDSISSSSSASNQAFVAMWFSPEMDLAYDEGFEPAIIDNGYRSLRIDKKEHANKIDDEIIAEIRRSRFVVADFTCQVFSSEGGKVAIPRGGVYYEAGFAQGLNIDVIWTVRSDCIDYVHFDTRQYSHIVWNDPADLRRKLRNRIGAVIGQAAP